MDKILNNIWKKYNNMTKNNYNINLDKNKNYK